MHLLITQGCPEVICLHETFVKSGDRINIKNYQLFNYIYDPGCSASGGVSILIRNEIPHSKVNIQTNIEAVTIKTTLHKAVNVCSIYFPPSDNIDENEEKNMADQLPKPFILLGDFNRHNTLWVCKDTNKKGKILENIINENDMCILNNGALTYVNPSSGHH